MKKTIFSVLILGLIVAVVYYRQLQPETGTEAQVSNVSSSTSVPASQTGSSDDLVSEKSLAELDSEPESGPFDELTTRRWHDSRGYPTANDGYNAYDADTIFALAEQGDVLAMQRAASMLILLKKDYSAGYSMLMNAAARGSTFSLTLLGNHFRDGGIPVGEGDHVLEALPYYIAAGLRGDVRQANEQIAITTGQGGLIARITGGARPKRDLQPHEIDEVCSRGREIYNQIQSRRIELGLSDFDNTPMLGTEDKLLSLCWQ